MVIKFFFLAKRMNVQKDLLNNLIINSAFLYRHWILSCWLRWWWELIQGWPIWWPRSRWWWESRRARAGLRALTAQRRWKLNYSWSGNCVSLCGQLSMMWNMRLVKIFIPENTFTCCFLSGIRSKTASSRAPGSGVREAPDSVIFSCLGDLYRSREFSKNAMGL